MELTINQKNCIYEKKNISLLITAKSSIMGVLKFITKIPENGAIQLPKILLSSTRKSGKGYLNSCNLSNYH